MYEQSDYSTNVLFLESFSHHAMRVKFKTWATDDRHMYLNYIAVDIIVNTFTEGE
jgi:hypothetical protein